MINIRTVDGTVYLNREITNENIVLVMGSHDTGDAGIEEPVLCRSLNQFYRSFGEKPGPKEYSDSDSLIAEDQLGWIYAANLIRLGFPVLFYSYYKTPEGGKYDASDAVSARNKFTIENHFNDLTDKILYRVKFIPTLYEYADGATLANINKFITNVAEVRMDCEVIADFPSCSGDKLNKDGTLNKSYLPYLANGVARSEFVGIPGPAGAYDDPLTSQEIIMPPSFWILKTMAEGVSRGIPIASIWAGAKRGVISDVKRWTSKLSYQESERWSKMFGLIPMLRINPYGDLIYGNRTHKNAGQYDIKVVEVGGESVVEEGEEVTPPTTTTTEVAEEIEFDGNKSALRSLNVALLANEVRRDIQEVCLGLAFDTNDIVLWTEFKEKMIPRLEGYKAGRSMNDYLIIMDRSTVTDEDIDNLVVPGVVKVEPALAAEDFDITFGLTPTGALFTNNNA